MSGFAMGWLYIQCELDKELFQCACRADRWQWSDGRIVALLVLAFVLLISFVLIQVWKPEQATVPPSIFIQRSVASGFWASCCVGAHQTLLSTYTLVLYRP
jgi:hypothetical protein